MNTIEEKLRAADWVALEESMHEKGYALLPGVLDEETCSSLIRAYDEPQHYRSVISMEQYRFGQGEYKYFQYPLPPLLQAIRENVYEKLAPVANRWMEALDIERRFPSDLGELHRLCRDNSQTKPTVLILQYGAGGHNTLHQDLYGEVFFPMQLVLFLSEPGVDYEGGAFILLEQRPRAQSKAIVLHPKKGDLLLFTTNFRPVKGSKGYYRAAMRHGVSEVHSGRRYTVGIIFHAAS